MAGNLTFDDFLREVNPTHMDFVLGLHEHLLQNGCSIKLESAKSGYVLSYLYNKRTLANYVFRKSGMLIRIYADNLRGYAEVLETLPEEMVKVIAKAPLCKRLAETASCNSRCPMGYAFDLQGEHYKKCRYNSFLLPVNDTSIPYLRRMVEGELGERAS